MEEATGVAEREAGVGNAVVAVLVVTAAATEQVGTMAAVNEMGEG